MKIFNTQDQDFLQNFEELLLRGQMDIDSVLPKVMTMLDEVKKEGIDAICNQIDRFDGWSPKNLSDLVISKEECRVAYDGLDQATRSALHQAYERIYTFHSKQKLKTWIDFEDNGTILGQKVTPMQRAGLYIPGGKAAYPSSLLMNAIPALVAGVKEIIVCSPTPLNKPNPLLLAAAHLCNIHTFYKVGGVGAIGLMAYGTPEVPKVDIITGPGNIYVAVAKKMVFGEVMVDMIAGPSEILVIADEKSNAHYVACDLLSQAEHDELASSILLTTSHHLAQEVKKEIFEILPRLGRQKIAQASIENRGVIIVCKNMQECIDLSNKIAPEHLELMIENPFAYLSSIQNCGAIFLGPYTPEAIGDYIAGPNHTLPTGGGAHFFSPLSVDHFMKKSSIISMSALGFKEVAKNCEILAEVEGLGAHKDCVQTRMKDLEKI